MAKWFHECPTLSEAHQLSATVFGVENSDIIGHKKLTAVIFIVIFGN
ncbi:DUF2397 family protein [Enterococcus casseliflavus]|uniref:DUF2397 family protein n=1 Tax=Enterococcus casseliflavus TaxID=37734 RepID=A0A415EP17_ENTCA|nr:DUF2397 family protein [Enterococcus casseliflavus]